MSIKFVIRIILVEFFKRVPFTKGHKIVVVCMPKSGSTYLFKKICRYTGFPRIHVSSHPEVQEFDQLNLYRLYTKNLVDQIHCIGSRFAVNQLNEIKGDVIILYRNLYDITMSVVDFMHSEEILRNYKKWGFATLFGTIYPSSFYELSQKEQYDFVITNTIPTYVHFFASWKKYSDHLTKSPIWISYDDFFANKEKGLRKVLEHCSLPIDENKLHETIEIEEETRYNRGVSREKREGVLSNNQRKNIEIIASFYPEYKNILLRRSN